MAAAGPGKALSSGLNFELNQSYFPQKLMRTLYLVRVLVYLVHRLTEKHVGENVFEQTSCTSLAQTTDLMSLPCACRLDFQ
jgi:hypothetical protein